MMRSSIVCLALVAAACAGLENQNEESNLNGRGSNAEQAAPITNNEQSLVVNTDIQTTIDDPVEILPPGESITVKDLPPLETVPFVDIDRYLGKWYEIATIPKWFQWRCVAAEAEYSLKEDGSIRVDNRCRNFNLDGGFRTTTGSAEAVDSETNAKLEVTFFRFFKGDYWIIELDEEDYQYAVVGAPKRNTLWILSRTRQMDEELYERLMERIVEVHKYNRSDIVKSIQPE